MLILAMNRKTRKMEKLVIITNIFIAKFIYLGKIKNMNDNDNDK